MFVLFCIFLPDLPLHLLSYSAHVTLPFHPVITQRLLKSSLDICILHSDWCASSWQWESTEGFQLGLLTAQVGAPQCLFCAFAVELSSLAIMSTLTKRSKGFLRLLASSVEMVFMWPMKAKSSLQFVFFRRQETSVSIPWLFVGSYCPYDTELHSCYKFL